MALGFGVRVTVLADLGSYLSTPEVRAQMAEQKGVVMPVNEAFAKASANQLRQLVFALVDGWMVTGATWYQVDLDMFPVVLLRRLGRVASIGFDGQLVVGNPHR